MAKIESRRLKRRIARYALPVCAALIICAVIVGALLLKKSCAKNEKGNSPSYTEAPVVTQAVGTATVEEPTAAPENTYSTPTQSAASPAPEKATSVPEQTTEDRSLMCFVLDAGSNSAAYGVKLAGSCSAQFVNNTDSVMYAAYFAAEGFAVTKAAADGAPVRFENGEGIILLPFVRELMPGESMELYFEFEGAAVSEFHLPRPAYDTAFDAVCFVTSDRPLGFSCGEPTSEMRNGAYVYRAEAQRVTEIIILSE